MEGRGQVRDVMLDRMHARVAGVAGKDVRELFTHAQAPRAIADAVQHQGQVGPVSHGVAQALPRVRTAVLVDRHMVEVLQLHPGLGQAIADGFGRKAGPMLDAPKAFFLGRGNENPVAHDARGCVAVVGIDSQDKGHVERVAALSRRRRS